VKVATENVLCNAAD